MKDFYKKVNKRRCEGEVFCFKGLLILGKIILLDIKKACLFRHAFLVII